MRHHVGKHFFCGIKGGLKGTERDREGPRHLAVLGSSRRFAATDGHVGKCTGAPPEGSSVFSCQLIVVLY
jgi:hypothetical protein